MGREREGDREIPLDQAKLSQESAELKTTDAERAPRLFS